MAKTSIVAKLKALQKKWEAATPKTGGGLPNGDYEGVIKSAVIKACDNGELRCAWELEITAPENFVGRKWTKNTYLGGDNSLEWFKGDLVTLGVDVPDDATEMSAAVAETEGLPVAFKVVNKQENCNIYFIGVLEDGGTITEAADETPEETTDDTLTAEMITAMGEADDEAGLQAIIDEYEIDINQDDYETYAEVADLVIAALEL